MNKEWPEGSLKQVSRESYNAVRRARGYPQMTPEQRLATAKSFDRLFKRTPKSADVKERVQA